MANVNYNGQSASGGATSLNQLTDVNITSPSDDQVLMYDNGDWVNKAIPSPTVPDDLNDLDDVNISSPSDGQIFKYNGTSSKWENANMPAIPNSADDISYDNTTSGLTADDVQEALDEIDGNVDTLSGKVYKTDDSTDTTIASDDKIPFYDVSATSRKNITVANMISGVVSNPNLLDNPWFTVNQRGQATYTGDNTFKYTVDRWAFVSNSSSSVSVINNDRGGVNVTIDSSSADNAFVQIFDKNGAEIENKTITVSIILDDIIYSGSITVPAIPQTGWDVRTILEPISGFLVELARNSIGTTQIVIRPPKNGNTYSIKAVKVEIGNISTLAMDTIPNYATELLKCQRYFVKYDGGTEIGTGFENNTTTAYILAPLPTFMRTGPAITFGGTGRLQDPGHIGDNGLLVSAIEYISYRGNIVKLKVTMTGGTAGYACNLALRGTNPFIAFSADL